MLCQKQHLALLSVLLFACGEPPKKAREPAAPEDEWTRTPRTAEWLYATRDVNGNHETECKAVATVIHGEATCSGALCAHGRDLAKDWLTRCPKHDQADEASVREDLASYKEKASHELSSCGEEAEGWLRSGCGNDCAALTTAWATRCGKSDGSPLVLRMLERAVERKTGERATLDPRGCSDLFVTVREGASCAQQFACEDAAKKLDVYRARCESEEQPATLLSAVVALAIQKGALLPGKPVSLGKSAGTLSSRDLPTALDDGTGAALSVCGERALDLAGYLDKRAKCQGGSVVVAKAFRKDGDFAVRLGEIPHASDAAFARSFPSLLLHGETELRDTQALTSFQRALDAATAEKRGDAALALLTTALSDNAARIRRSPAYRKELTDRDAALVPVFTALGAAKAKMAKTRMSPPDLGGFVARGAKRPLSDINDHGRAELSASTPAAGLELGDLLPQAMAAYARAMAPAAAQTKLRKPDAKSLAKARAAARAEAESCGVAEKRLGEAEQSLIACVFALDSCDETRTAAITTSMADARGAAESARARMDVAATIAGAEDEITQVAGAAGCLDLSDSR